MFDSVNPNIHIGSEERRSRMEEYDSKDFGKNFTPVRHIYEPLVGGWDLYKNKNTNEKYLVKEIKFYSELDRDEYLPRITQCSIFHTKKDNGFVRCLGYCRKNISVEDGVCYALFVMFEYYETTFEKAILKKIKDSESYNVKDIVRIIARLASSLEILERQGLLHGDVRSGNIAIMPDGKLKLLWTPFNRTTTELLLDRANPNLMKVMNPSPEVIEAFNEAQMASNGLSMYPDMTGGIAYPRNDVYSLGILMLKISNLYSTEGFYTYSPGLKVNTKKVEMGILKLHSINNRLGVIANNMLCYDPIERWTFSQVVQVLESKTEQGFSEIGGSLPNIYKPENNERSDRYAPDLLATQTDPGDLVGPNEFQPEGTSQLGSPWKVNTQTGPLYQPLGANYASTSKRPFEAPLSTARSRSPRRANTARHTNLGATGTLGSGLMTTAKPASPIDLFTQRELAELKTDFISLLESTIYFGPQGKLRPGMRIKETQGHKYVGELFCGKRAGFGVYYYQNGDVCAGNWINGDMQGESIYLYKDGSVYLGSVRENKKDGFGRMLYANGDVYEGEWLKNKRNNQGIYYYYSTETVYEGSWILNFKEGWGAYYNRNGEWVEGEWKANRLVSRSSQGFDDNFPRLRNIVEFYSNRLEWQEIIDRLQALLDKKTEENYNYVDPSQYDDIGKDIIRDSSNFSPSGATKPKFRQTTSTNKKPAANPARESLEISYSKASADQGNRLANARNERIGNKMSTAHR